MPLLHGKQIRNTTIDLNKLSGTGSVILNSGAVFQVPTGNISVNTDIVNKEYVDSVAIGLVPHASVKTITTGNVGLTAPGTNIFSGYTASAGDRILVWQQIDPKENGIYDFSASASALTRSDDMDGNPTSEVKVGDYTFATDGHYRGNGYVIIGGTSGVIRLVGTDSIVWSEFIGPDNLTYGNGLVINDRTIDVDLTATSGLTFSAGKLTVDSTIAGDGLAYAAGILSVNATNGLSVNSDNVKLGGTLTEGTSINGGGQSLDLGTFGSKLGGLTSYSNAQNTIHSEQLIAIQSWTSIETTSNGYISNTADTTLTNFAGGLLTNNGSSAAIIARNTNITLTANNNVVTTATGSIINTAGTMSITTTNNLGAVYTSDYSATFVNESLVSKRYVDSLTKVFIDTATIDFTTAGPTVSAVIVAGSITASLLNSTGGATAGYVLSVGSDGVFNWVDAAATGDITAVNAGEGLTGGGLSGGVTVSVAQTIAGNGLTFSAGVIDVLTSNGVTIINDSVQLNQTVAGNGLTFSAGVVDINASNGVTILNDSVQLNQTVAGSGLTFSAGVVDINTSNGVTIINDSVQLNQTVAGNGLTFSAGVVDINTSNGVTILNDSVQLNQTVAGSGLTFSAGVVNVTAANTSVLVNVDSIQSAVPVTSNKEMTASVTTADFQIATGTGIASTPAAGSYVQVLVNGQSQIVGNGVKTKDCYFSGDGGTTARAFSAIVSGDELYWVGSVAGYELATIDKIDFMYVTA